MKKYTVGTLFSGGGFADVGFEQAGFQPIWGIEKDEAIAKIFRKNFPDSDLINLDIREANPEDFEPVTVLHASPPCQQFSIARRGTMNKHIEADAGSHVVKFIRYLQPEIFTLENVPGYRQAISFSKIIDELKRLQYYIEYRVFDFSNFGVPQSRNRLFLVASQNPFLIPQIKIQHYGWYRAIAHLIGDMESTKLAAWQRKQLPEDSSLPLLFPRNGGGKSTKPRKHWQPCHTIRAFEQHRGTHWADIILDDCVKKISIEATAALTTVPPEYKLPKNKSLSQRILGNAVPPTFIKTLITSLMEATNYVKN